MGLDAMILVFWMLSFKPAFKPFSFTLINRLFSSCLLQLYRYILSFFFRFFSHIGEHRVLSGEGNGTPLQYSCLENPMDGGAWWAAVHGVARVGQDWSTSLSLFTFVHWRRKWQPTPVFLLGESQGRGSLVGCRLWGRTASDTTGATQQQQQQQQQ